MAALRAVISMSSGIEVPGQLDADQFTLARDAGAVTQQGQARVQTVAGNVLQEVGHVLLSEQFARGERQDSALRQIGLQVHALEVRAGFGQHQRPGRIVDLHPGEPGDLPAAAGGALVTVTSQLRAKIIRSSKLMTLSVVGMPEPL